MIDYKNNYIFSLLNIRALKVLSQRVSTIFYDKRTKSAFKKILAAPRPFNKYYFADTTMQRVKAMDLKNCYPVKLGYMFEKYGTEVGICMCKENDLAFVYTIGATDIQLIVTNAKNKTITATIDDFGNISYAKFNKAIAGACVISYHKNDVDILANNTISMFLNTRQDKTYNYQKEQIKELSKLSKENSLLPENVEFKDATIKDNPYIFNLYNDFNTKSNKIWLAIKMFIFLKTAKVIEQTFISENEIYGDKSKSKQNDSNGIIMVDSTWDSSINVINPFSVSGHFRNQPKKNKKNEWYKELIYIDSFMKSGYHRKAKCISQ